VAGGTDGPPAAVARVVAALGQPGHGRVDLDQIVTGLAEQRGDMLPLECDRRAFRVMLVVGAGHPGRLDDSVELPLQPIQPVGRLRPKPSQHRPRLVLPRHLSWIPVR